MRTEKAEGGDQKFRVTAWAIADTASKYQNQPRKEKQEEEEETVSTLKDLGKSLVMGLPPRVFLPKRSALWATHPAGGSAFSVRAHGPMGLKIPNDLCSEAGLARQRGVKDLKSPSLGPKRGRREPHKLSFVLYSCAMAHTCELRLTKQMFFFKKKKRTKENKINKEMRKIEILTFCAFY